MGHLLQMGNDFAGLGLERSLRPNGESDRAGGCIYRYDRIVDHNAPCYIRASADSNPNRNTDTANDFIIYGRDRTSALCAGCHR